MSPAAGIALVLVSLTACMLFARALQRRGFVGSETARKIVHVGMGSVCLSFPWLFGERWPVWTLAGIAGVALSAVRFVPVLRRALGSVLHDVNRASWGEVYFPLGVAAVFTLADGNRILFVVPVAMLTFADAAGALVGRRWGRRLFETLEGTKSVEGSLAVGLTGFACVTGPLLAVGHNAGEALSIGATMGMFSMMLEAISWRGLDNALLPLAGFAQLSVYLALSREALVARLLALAAIAAVALAWRRGHLVDDCARLGAALALYFFWAVGGWTWLIAPLVLLVSYVRLMPTVPGGVPRHNLVAVICVASAGLVWGVAAAFAPDPRWLWPFTLGVAMHQGVIAIVRFSQGRPGWPRAAWWAVGTTQAAGLHVLTFALADGGRTVNAIGFLAGALCLAAGTAGFVLWEKKLRLPDDLNARWWKQGTVALAASTAGFYFMHR
ncbi:MAG: hypothetical protein ABIZ49_02015 [Opitutaceae bacterium]